MHHFMPIRPPHLPARLVHGVDARKHRLWHIHLVTRTQGTRGRGRDHTRTRSCNPICTRTRC